MKRGGPHDSRQAEDAIHDGVCADLNEDDGTVSAGEVSRVDAKQGHRQGAGRLPPRLVSQQEAAAYLGISYWTLRDLVFRRDLPSLRIGRRLLLDLRDLDAFIADAKTTGS